MSEDQFQTLKQMIESMRASMEARFEQVDKRFEHVEQRFNGVEKWLERVEIVLDLKPDHRDIYTAVFTVVFGLFGLVVGSVVLANILGWLN